MRLSVEDTRTGKVIKLDVKEHHQVERIIDIVIKHMGIISVEQRSYTLVLHDKELPNSITIEEASEDGVMLAYKMNGKPLTSRHGFPVRMVVPKKYGMKWPKWVNEIEFYQDKAIFYGIGNFVFDQTHTDPTRQGVLLKFYFFKKNLVSVKIIPHEACGPQQSAIDDENCNHFQPQVLDEEDPVYKEILERIFEYSEV